jgi:hypothetical protein
MYDAVGCFSCPPVVYLTPAKAKAAFPTLSPEGSRTAPSYEARSTTTAGPTYTAMTAVKKGGRTLPLCRNYGPVARQETAMVAPMQTIEDAVAAAAVTTTGYRIGARAAGRSHDGQEL